METELTDGNSQFDRIPNEILDDIFKYLKRHDKRNARLVCKRWRNRMDDPCSKNCLFRARISSLESFNSLLHSRLFVVEMTMVDLVEDLPTMTYSRSTFPQMQCATIGTGNSTRNLLKFLKHGCESLKSLLIVNFGFTPLNFGYRAFNIGRSISHLMSEIKWTNLHSLDISVCDEFETSFQSLPHRLAIEHLLYVARMRKLSTFRVALHENSITASLKIRLVTGVYNFIARHSSTLKSLRFACSMGVVPIEGPIPIERADQDRMANHLGLEDLTVRIELRMRANEFVLPCLGGSNLIRKLVWEHSMLINGAGAPPSYSRSANLMEELISKNENTLQELHLGCATCDLNWLKNCIWLTKLEVGALERNSRAARIHLPNLKSLSLLHINYFPERLDSWIFQRFPNVETIEISYYCLRVFGTFLFDLFEGLIFAESVKNLTVNSYFPYQGEYIIQECAPIINMGGIDYTITQEIHNTAVKFVKNSRFDRTNFQR